MKKNKEMVVRDRLKAIGVMQASIGRRKYLATSPLLTPQ